MLTSVGIIDDLLREVISIFGESNDRLMQERYQSDHLHESYFHYSDDRLILC